MVFCFEGGEYGGGCSEGCGLVTITITSLFETLRGELWSMRGDWCGVDTGGGRGDAVLEAWRSIARDSCPVVEVVVPGRKRPRFSSLGGVQDSSRSWPWCK